MDGYLLFLCVGFGGLLLMSLLGLGHHQGGSHSHAHGHSHGHGGHASCGAHGHSHHSGQNSHPAVAARGHAARAHARGAGFKGGRTAHLLLTLISPRVLFSLLFGFGAVGVLLQPAATHWPVVLLPGLAATGAIAFEWFVVQPLWRLLFGFASAPAQTLESIVLEEGQAVTNFDATGHGLIAVDLDGQVRQLLGSLPAEERAVGERVRAGDRVFIRAIDAQRNSCVVSRLN